jgi:glycosyltransferase involved in cell wall biosynthesis
LINLIDINNTLTNQICIVNSLFLPQEKLVTIPNGVFIPDVSSLDLKENIAVIVSAMIPRKAILEGIRFFNENLRPHGFRLFIIGPNSTSLDGYSSSYATECFRYADDIVNFMGELSHSETLNILSKAKFLIHLSRHEGMPNVVLEAMVYCVYPIVSNMNGLAVELIDDGVTGFNIDLNNEFTSLSSLLLNNDGRKQVINNNSFAHICRKTVDVYKALESNCLE